MVLVTPDDRCHPPAGCARGPLAGVARSDDRMLSGLIPYGLFFLVVLAYTVGIELRAAIVPVAHSRALNSAPTAGRSGCSMR